MFEAKQAVVDQAKLEEEMGDLLFATVNMARHLGTKAETALQKRTRNLSDVFVRLSELWLLAVWK